MIKAGIGLEVAFVDTGQIWDTHVNEGGGRGQLANLLRDFSNSISAFATDLDKRMDDVVLITMSELAAPHERMVTAAPTTATPTRCLWLATRSRAARSTAIFGG
jgi:uncharacterized protein (DUF1501 family)